MLHDLMRWIQDSLGKDICDTDANSPFSSSWSGNFHEAQTLWSICEGAHVLTLCLFAGTILLVDLRMLGLAFKKVPFSKLNEKVLPLTIVGFAMMIITGVLLFLSKPEDYYHNPWFRTKMAFLVIASLNIFWFHFVVQKDEAKWDAMEKPPLKVRMSAIVSLSCWTIIICFGRFIPYNWFEPGRVLSMIQDSEIAKAQAEGKITDRQLAKAVEKGIIPTLPVRHDWTFGDSMANGFFHVIYFISEYDRVRGPAPTLDSLIYRIEHRSKFVGKLPIEAEGEKDTLAIEQKCLAPADSAKAAKQHIHDAAAADVSEAEASAAWEEAWPETAHAMKAEKAWNDYVRSKPGNAKPKPEEHDPFVAKWLADNPQLDPVHPPSDPPPGPVPPDPSEEAATAETPADAASPAPDASPSAAPSPAAPASKAPAAAPKTPVAAPSGKN